MEVMKALMKDHMMACCLDVKMALMMATLKATDLALHLE